MNTNNSYPTKPPESGITFTKCQNIKVSKIKTAHRTNQTRKGTLNAQHLQDLEEHIHGHGLQKPIIVSLNKNGSYYVESGHHRFKCFQNLKMNSIPAYVATFPNDNGVTRLKWLNKENSHPPALPHCQEDAVKFLQDVKNTGEFEGMTADQQKDKAFEWLSEFYTHFSPQKKGRVYESFLRSEGETQYIVHTKASKQDHALKYGYTVNPTDYDNEIGAYYINADVGNAKKNIATINCFGNSHPSDMTNPKQHVFAYTRGKTSQNVKSRRLSFLSDIVDSNRSRLTFKVEKVFFLPEIEGDTKCEIWLWNAMNRKFVKNK